MDFETVLSNPYTKKYLNETIISDRIAHAQLFIGEEGVGTLPMAIAYATEILTRKGYAKIIQQVRLFLKNGDPLSVKSHIEAYMNGTNLLVLLTNKGK